MLHYHGPKYIRLGKGSEPAILSHLKEIEENVFIQDGSSEIAILSTGQILHEVLRQFSHGARHRKFLTYQLGDLLPTLIDLNFTIKAH
jgi:hypothetical protein